MRNAKDRPYMRPIIRLLTLLLAFLLVCSASACADSTPDPTTGSGAEGSDTGSEIPSDYATDLPNKDLGGATIVFLAQSDPCFVHFYDVNVTQYNDGVINEAVYIRNRTVESALHVTITDYDAGSNANEELKRTVLSGDDDYDAAWIRTDYFFATSLEGHLRNIYEMPNLDLSKLYWDQHAQDDYLVGDKLFGIMGDISTSANMFTHLFGINKKVAKEHGVDVSSLYNTVLNGDWTLGAFLEVCSHCEWADLNGNGTRDGLDQFAFGVSPSFIFGGFSAAGEMWIVKDENNHYALSELTQRKIDVLEAIINLTNDKNMTVATWNIGSVPGETDTYGYTYRTKFENNTLLFSDLDMGEVLDTRATMKDDFGIVPLPKYDQSQTEYSVFAYPFYPLLCIPGTVTEEKQETVGYVLEVLGSESYKTLTPAFYDIAMGGMVLRDEESTQMLDLILRSRRYELLLIYQWSGDSFRTQLQDMILNGKNAITSVYRRNEKSLNNAIEEVMEKVSKLE